MNRKHALFSLVTILVLTFSLLSPSIAWAEDEQPPDPAATEPSVGTEEQASVPEIPEQAPEGSDMVVVVTEGETVLLVSEEAAAILGNSDPVWCPGTDLPGSPNCTTNQASVTALITYLLDPDTDPLTPTPYTGIGTIYFQDGVYAGPESTISFDNTLLAALTDLGLEGGWNLLTNTKVTDGLTVFNDPIYLNWFHNLEMQDIVISADYDGYSLEIVSEGDVTLTNVDVIDNDDGSGAFINTCVMEDINPDPDITEWACTETGVVTITDATFDGNTGDGLWVEAGGTINLSSVSASDNGLWGAGLDNEYGSGPVQIGSSDFDDNGSRGLGVWTDGIILMDHTSASGNADGAVLYAGNIISITSSDFIGNDYDGLWAETNIGNISLTSVTASDNVYGATVWTEEGDITVTGGEFNDNTLIGLEAGTMVGSVTLTNVTAGNAPALIVPLVAVGPDTGQEIGVHLENMDGPITVSGGFFGGNLEKGLYIVSAGGIANPVLLDGVQASENGLKGAYISYLAPCGTTTGGVTVNVIGGLYQTNGAYGIYAMVGPEGDLILDAVTPPDFGTDIDTWNGTPPDSLYSYLVNTDVIPCPPPCEPEPKSEPKPYNIIEVPATGGSPVEQNCADFNGTILILPDDDKVTLACPATGMVEAAQLTEAELPGNVPGGPTFLSALQITLMDGDQPIPVITNGGYITVAFKIPEDARPNDRFAILYWDPTGQSGAGAWVELPEYRETIPGRSNVFPLHPDADPDDLMRILAGTHSLGGYVKANVNFPGVFVLIKR